MSRFMPSRFFLRVPALALGMVFLLPQSQWAQQGSGQTMTVSEGVAGGVISGVDVAAGDTSVLPAIPSTSQRPALGERRPRGQGGQGGSQGGGSGGGSQGSGGNSQGGSSSGGGWSGRSRSAAAQAAAAGAEGAPAEGGRGGWQPAGAAQAETNLGGATQGEGAGSGQPQNGRRGGRGFPGGGFGAASANAAEGGAAGAANGLRGSRSGPAAEAADENTVQQIRMRDQGLPEVLNFLELLTNKAILRSQTLPALKVNFDSVGPMSRQEAILAIESLLAINGVAVTPVGDKFLKVVQTGEVAKQVPQFLSGNARDLPASQQFYTKYFKLDYLDAVNEGQPIVLGLMSVAGRQDGNPVIFPKSNSIMVTDMLSNLQRMEDVLEKSDKPAQTPTDLNFFPLKHVKAADLKNRLTTLINAKDSAIGSAFTYNTTIEADERTNQLIVATHPSNLALLKKLIDGLDGDVEPQTSSEVFYIKHAKAPEIATLLESVVSGQAKQREQVNSSQNAANVGAGLGAGAVPPAAAMIAEAASISGPGGSASVLTVGDMKNLQFSDYVTIAADERANAIVAYGTRSDLTQLGTLIDKIDILLAQVNIQVIIAEVTLSDGYTNGIDQLTVGYGANGLVTGGLPGWSTTAAGSTTDGVGQPFSFTGTLDPKAFQIMISNAKQSDDFRMLSAPVIVTTHNKEGKVLVTESRPIITGTVTQLGTGDGTTSNSVEYRNIGIELTVTPLIGNNGIIQMEIRQVVDNVTGTTTVNGNPQPIIGKREAESYVSVRDGEVVVLAGLQETSLAEKDNKLWLIGDIPLLGDLLNGRGEVSKRRELMIFIQPFVMTSDEQIARMSNQALDALDNSRDIRTYLETRDMSDVTSAQAVEKESKNTPAGRPVNGSFRRGGPR